MTASDSPRTTDVDAVVVGAGFSGLYMLHYADLRIMLRLSWDRLQGRDFGLARSA